MFVNGNGMSCLADIFQMKMLTLLCFVKILYMTPNTSPQQIEMTKFGPSVMNDIMLTHCQISCLHEIQA